MIRCHRRLRLAVAGLAALLTGLAPAWAAPGLAATRAAPALYQELYRPQFHFTPAQNWMNDPNGLVY
jgi:fructan beta-fructosidase